MFHQPDEIKGAGWFFSTEELLKQAGESVFGDKELRKRLGSEGNDYEWHHIHYGRKRELIIFVYRPTTDKEAINEVFLRMKSHSGKKLTAKEMRSFAKLLSHQAQWN